VNLKDLPTNQLVLKTALIVPIGMALLAGVFHELKWASTRVKAGICRKGPSKGFLRRQLVATAQLLIAKIAWWAAISPEQRRQRLCSSPVRRAPGTDTSGTWAQGQCF
jgi:hypothetical protein